MAGTTSRIGSFVRIDLDELDADDNRKYGAAIMPDEMADTPVIVPVKEGDES